MVSQLRGQKLKDRIRDGILYLSKGEKDFRLNQSELSRHIGVSRPTLSKYKEHIEIVLKEISAEIRTSDGTAGVEFLIQKLERLEKNEINLLAELDAYKTTHLEIFQLLLLNSVEVADLVRPLVLRTHTYCPLCGHDNIKTAESNSNKVIDITRNKKVD